MGLATIDITVLNAGRARRYSRSVLRKRTAELSTRADRIGDGAHVANILAWACANVSERKDTTVTTVQDIVNISDPSLAVSAKSPAAITADALIVGVQGPDKTVNLGPAANNKLSRALAQLAEVAGASGSADSVTVVPAPSNVSARLVAFTGLGSATSDDAAAHAESLRRAVGAAVRHLAGKAESVVVALPTTSVDEVQAVAEGAGMGAFSYTAQKVRTLDDQSSPVTSATLCVAKDLAKRSQAAVERAAHVVKAVRTARNLVDLSPDTANPEFVAEYATAAAKGSKIKVTVLAEKELARGNYGGLLGVGQGSVNGPRLVKLEWAPAKAKRHVSFVGKGITFDSGGLSLKPAASMMTMKSDMAGAAAVLATVMAAADLKLPVAVTGWLCLAENLPAATATRPGDVLTMHSGHTVEVLNTDAEGRLVLADGLWAAGQEDPDLLVDIATLTGAQMVALGTRTAGVMGDEAARDMVSEAASAAGEATWTMPLPEHMRASLNSNVADLKNIGDKHGGMLVAGLFLREFVPQIKGNRVPWAHVDIAGPSFNEGSPWGYTPKEGTGFGVRTLLSVAENYAS